MIIGYIVAGSIVLLGIALFFYFSTRKNYYRKPAEPVQEYEEVRDKVTLRKKKEVVIVDDDEGFGFQFSIGNIIGGFVVILVGVSMIGPIATQVNNVYNQTVMQQNSTTYGSEMLGATTKLIVPFFAITLLFVVIAVMYGFLRNVSVV